MARVRPRSDAANYLGRYASDDTPQDVAYQWVSSVAIVVQFGLMLGILLLITIGLPKRELAHGLLIGLPVLTFFGIVVAWLRAKTGSVYAGILLHAVFNGIALLVSVAA